MRLRSGAVGVVARGDEQGGGGVTPTPWVREGWRGGLHETLAGTIVTAMSSSAT